MTRAMAYFEYATPSFAKASSACTKLDILVGTLRLVPIFLFVLSLVIFPFGAVRLCA